MLVYSAIDHNREVPDNFIYVREVIPGLAVDLKYFDRDNFVGQRIEGYEANRLILTLEASTALNKVQNDLAYCGLALKVFDGYRPQRAVDAFIKWAHDADELSTKARFYPNIAKAEIFPQGYLLERSSHSRGSTVDLTLIDIASHREVDMGTEFDFFDISSWPSCSEMSLQQRANRMLLRSAMNKRGFLGVDEEWWHFTLHDEPYPDTCFDFPVK